ncbi:MAG: flavin reductase [Treponemataceae bacterium]|nr:flavin reductase [Treponemataceae bacterium]
MSDFKPIKAEEISDNLIKMIGSDWMLITAGNRDKFNTMTASWGFAGFMWNRPSAICFVRPERYTYSFMERADNYTLSFFSDEYKDALKLCGAKSGKNTDKPKEAGLTPKFLSNGTVSFEEASIILSCRKVYTDNIKPENFLVQHIIDNVYNKEGFHRMYIGEITQVLKKN